MLNGMKEWNKIDINYSIRLSCHVISFGIEMSKAVLSVVGHFGKNCNALSTQCTDKKNKSIQGKKLTFSMIVN
jgi:hypothetical protein